MAGQLTIDTLIAGSGVLATQNGMTGIAKAWVNFNGTGTPAIRGSFNVSSITDNGTGDYTVNFTTAMPNANYSALTTTRRSGGNDNQGLATVYPNATYSNAISTTFVRVVTGTSSNGALSDFDYVAVSVFSS